MNKKKEQELSLMFMDAHEMGDKARAYWELTHGEIFALNREGNLVEAMRVPTGVCDALCSTFFLLLCNLMVNKLGWYEAYIGRILTQMWFDVVFEFQNYVFQMLIESCVSTHESLIIQC